MTSYKTKEVPAKNAVSFITPIVISNNYRIANNARAWMLQEQVTRKHRRTGTLSQEWRAIRWYTSLQAALNDLPELCLRVMGVPDSPVLGQARQAVLDTLAGLGEAYRTEIMKHLQALPIGK